jgi:glycosyltransferase involved in cell wall biosynthesis
MNSKISVIIPVYNAANYVGRCIESVQAQTYNDWQMILVDDGSKDNSWGVCQKYADMDKRIHVIHQENQGPGIARNTGIAKAYGDYVVFIDSDDYIEKDYFELLAKHDEDVVFINVQNVDEQGNVLKKDFMSNNKRLTKDMILRRQMTGRIDWGGV